MPRTLSLHEITELLETDDSIEANAIVIQPPENATASVSDEDSRDEEGGTQIICQVLCYAHLHILFKMGMMLNLTQMIPHTHLKMTVLTMKFQLRLLRSNLLHQRERK